MTAQEDLYEVLQVGRSADQDVIRAAYRALAQRLHPDRNSSPQAAERMKQLNQAYDVLSDPVRRAAYHRRIDSGAGGSDVTPGSGKWSAARPRLARWRERLGILPMTVLGLIAVALLVASAIDGPPLNPGTVIGALGLAWVGWSLFRRFKSPGV